MFKFENYWMGNFFYKKQYPKTANSTAFLRVLLIKKIAQHLKMGKKRFWVVDSLNNSKINQNPIYTLCQGFDKNSYGCQTTQVTGGICPIA